MLPDANGAGLTGYTTHVSSDIYVIVASSQISTGIGTNRYGAQVIVFADNREDAIAKGKEHFASAVEKAGLPVYPIVRVEATSEDEDEADDL